MRTSPRVIYEEGYHPCREACFTDTPAADYRGLPISPGHPTHLRPHFLGFQNRLIIPCARRPPQDEAAVLEGDLEASHAAQLADLESRAAAEAQQDSRQQDAAEGAEEHPEDAVAAALAANSLYAKTAAAEKQVCYPRWYPF